MLTLISFVIAAFVALAAAQRWLSRDGAVVGFLRFVALVSSGYAVAASLLGLWWLRSGLVLIFKDGRIWIWYSPWLDALRFGILFAIAIAVLLGTLALKGKP